MYDVRTNQLIVEDVVMFNHPDSSMVYLESEEVEQGVRTVFITDGSHQAVAEIRSEQEAEYMIKALQYAIDNNFFSQRMADEWPPYDENFLNDGEHSE